MPDISLTLKEWQRIIRKGKWLILISVLFVTLSSLIFSILQKPVYLAKAIIAIESRLSPVASVSEDTNVSREIKDIFSIMKIQDEAYRQTVRLVAPEYIRGMLSDVKGGFDVEKIKNTNLVELKVAGSDPEKIALFANTVAQKYADSTIEKRLEAAKRLRIFLESQSDIHGTKVKKLQDAVKFEDDIEALERERDVLSKRLLELRLEQKRHSRNNPRFIEINAMIKPVQDKLKEVIDKEAERLRFERDFKIESQEQRDYLLKSMDARMLEEYKIPDARLVEWASVPAKPIGPNRVANVSFGALVGLIIGVAIAFFMEHTSTSLPTVGAVEGFIKLPVLGVIPYLKPLLILSHPMDSKGSEAYRQLRTNILSKASSGMRAFLITSAGSGEGKSLTCANVAIAMAAAGKRTLLLDTDLRKPAIHKMFGIPINPGITDILLQGIQYEEVIKRPSDIDNLYILPCGSPPSNPAEVLGSDNMKLFLEQLRQDFDIILADSPPVLPVADARILSSNLDGTILVYQAGVTDRQALMRAKTDLEQVGSALLGVVINNLSI